MFTKAIRELAKGNKKATPATVAEAKRWAKLVAADDVANGECRPEQRAEWEVRLFAHRLRELCGS